MSHHDFFLDDFPPPASFLSFKNPFCSKIFLVTFDICLNLQERKETVLAKERKNITLPPTKKKLSQRLPIRTKKNAAVPPRYHHNYVGGVENFQQVQHPSSGVRLPIIVASRDQR